MDHKRRLRMREPHGLSLSCCQHENYQNALWKEQIFVLVLYRSLCWLPSNFWLVTKKMILMCRRRTLFIERREADSSCQSPAEPQATASCGCARLACGFHVMSCSPTRVVLFSSFHCLNRKECFSSSAGPPNPGCGGPQDLPAFVLTLKSAGIADPVGCQLQ